MRLDEPRLGGDLLQIFQYRVEPLEVADLQHQPARLCQPHQLLGLRAVVGDRLLDEQVFAVFEQRGGDLEVVFGRRHDAQRVARAGESLGAVEHARAGLGHGALGGGAVNVEHTHQFRFGQFGINAHVVLAEMADANDADFDPGGHGFGAGDFNAEAQGTQGFAMTLRSSASSASLR